MGSGAVWRLALAGLAVVSISGCLTSTEVWERHPGAANSVIFQGCRADVGPQAVGGARDDVDRHWTGDVVGPFRDSWSWRVENDSYRRFEVFVTVRGAHGAPSFGVVDPAAELQGGNCSPVRWTLAPTAARQGQEWKLLRYASDYGGVGNWTFSLATGLGEFQYDVRVSIDYY